MVGVDVLSFRNRFWQRLMVNVGIVLVFAAFYLRFLKRAWAQSPQCARPTTGYAGALTGQTKVWLERKSAALPSALSGCATRTERRATGCALWERDTTDFAHPEERGDGPRAP